MSGLGSPSPNKAQIKKLHLIKITLKKFLTHPVQFIVSEAMLFG